MRGEEKGGKGREGGEMSKRYCRDVDVWTLTFVHVIVFPLSNIYTNYESSRQVSRRVSSRLSSRHSVRP